MRPWNEDMAWQRVQDVQREAENRRLIVAGGPPDARPQIWRLAVRAWSVIRRTAAGPVFVKRRPWPGSDCDDAEHVTYVA